MAFVVEKIHGLHAVGSHKQVQRIIGVAQDFTHQSDIAGIVFNQ